MGRANPPKNVRKHAGNPSDMIWFNKSFNCSLSLSLLNTSWLRAGWGHERRTCWSRVKVRVSRTNWDTESSAVDGYRTRLTSQALEQQHNSRYNNNLSDRHNRCRPRSEGSSSFLKPRLLTKAVLWGELKAHNLPLAHIAAVELEAAKKWTPERLLKVPGNSSCGRTHAHRC